MLPKNRWNICGYCMSDLYSAKGLHCHSALVMQSYIAYFLYCSGVHSAVEKLVVVTKFLKGPVSLPIICKSVIVNLFDKLQ